MKKIKLLFQGDSITDAGRDRNNYHNLGEGYPKYAAEYLKNKYSYGDDSSIATIIVSFNI